jgi:hypothetical protein
MEPGLPLYRLAEYAAQWNVERKRRAPRVPRGGYLRCMDAAIVDRLLNGFRDGVVAPLQGSGAK